MSALGDQGLSQGKMGAAIDTWRQTVLLDTDLLVFHGGVVELLQTPPDRYMWETDFACGVFPVGIDATDLDIGSRERVLGIVTGFYWQESEDTRDEAVAGIEDLEQLWDAAVWSNETLVWKTAGDGWPAVPPGSGATLNQAAARRVLAQLPTQYGSFLDENGERCGQRMAEFAAVYPIRFSN